MTKVSVCLDIGNTHLALGVFVEGELQQTVLQATEAWTVDHFDHIEGVSWGNVEQIKLVSVVPRLTSLIEDWSRSQNISERLHVISHEDHLDFAHPYEKKDDLGCDRLVLLKYAAQCHPNDIVMIVDSGTALTVDLVVKSVPQGGLISPGYRQRFEVLQQGAAQLPAVDAMVDDVPVWSRSTEDCIRSGVYHDLLYFLKGLYGHVLHCYPDEAVHVWLTGGDAGLYGDVFPNAVLDRDLVLKAVWAW